MIWLFLVACPRADFLPEPTPVESATVGESLSHRWPTVPSDHYPMKDEWLLKTDCEPCHSADLLNSIDYEKWACGPPWQPIPPTFKRWELILRKDPCALE